MTLKNYKEYTPLGEIPRKNIPRNIQLAMDFAITIYGWGLENYYHYTYYSRRYETTALWGV